MEKIISNPGLQHLAENVFWDLDIQDLNMCAQINQSCKQILENPMFWLKKFKSLSKKNQKDWIKVSKSVKNFDKEKAIISYLQWNLKKGAMDLPCYSSHAVQGDFREKIWEICEKQELSDEDREIVKILTPLTENPNAQRGYGSTPIYWAAQNEHTEIVKILALLTDNPNVPDKSGYTPIYWAALLGNTEIVKTLAPLTDNPNVPNYKGVTPILCATKMWNTEIVKIIATLTDNPNAAEKDGLTPIFYAAKKGNTEIIKILAPLTDNPNAPNQYGITPSSVAENAEIREILESV